MLIGTAKLQLPVCDGCTHWHTTPLRVDDKLIDDLQRAKAQAYVGLRKQWPYHCTRSGKTIRDMNVVVWKRGDSILAIQERASPFQPEELLDLTDEATSRRPL